MNLKRAIYLVIVLLGFATQQVHSQSYTSINGVINHYTSVTAIMSSDENNVDTVVVASSTGFNVGDTVMLYSVKGTIIGTQADSSYLPGNNGYPPGDDAQAPRNTGKYAFLIITEVIGNSVVLNATINSEILPMGAGEVAQLIRVPSYRYATVTSSGIAAGSWNPLTGTGGVVTMFVHGVLRLNGNIDVSGAGLEGAP
ncbi:MAG: hypothetical protein K8R52_02230, partial [Bacteroidales bacterium]|nr:hypothetical protein [Bacteroidales bacterium]